MDGGGSAASGTKAESNPGAVIEEIKAEGRSQCDNIKMKTKSLFYTPHPDLLPLIRGEGTL